MVVVFFFLGIFTGIFTGLTPGIHINVVASLMAAIYSSNLGDGDVSLPITIFIVTVSIVHTFFDYLPTLFLGVPTDEVYALLPGQKLIQQGNGGQALRLSIEGSWRGLLLGLLVALAFTVVTMLGLNLLSQIENLIKPFLFWILLSISLILITTEKQPFWSLSIFLLSGIFGIIALGSPLLPSGSSSAFSVFFPALSGLFGVSGLLLSLADEFKQLPEQKHDISLTINNKKINQVTTLGTFSGMAVGLLPGLGAANAAVLTLLLTGNGKTKESDKLYIVTTSAIQASDILFGVTALYLIDKSRSGASVAIESILGSINGLQIIAVIIAMGIAGLISRSILLSSWQIFIKVINNFNYRSLTLSVIIFITLLVLLTTGFWGGMVLLAGTSLGIIPPIIGIRRSQMMGFFLVPVMLFFSGFQREFVSFFHLESQLSPPSDIELNGVLIRVGICFIVAVITYFLKKPRKI